MTIAERTEALRKVNMGLIKDCLRKLNKTATSRAYWRAELIEMQREAHKARMANAYRAKRLASFVREHKIAARALDNGTLLVVCPLFVDNTQETFMWRDRLPAASSEVLAWLGY